jgi:hypothetical protein
MFVVHVHGNVGVWKRWFYAKAGGYPHLRGYRIHHVRALAGNVVGSKAGYRSSQVRHRYSEEEGELVRTKGAGLGRAGLGKARVRV